MKTAAWRALGRLAHWTVVLTVAAAVLSWNLFRRLAPRTQKWVAAGASVTALLLALSAAGDPARHEATLSADVADELPRASTTTTTKRIVESTSKPADVSTTTTIVVTTTVAPTTTGVSAPPTAPPTTQRPTPTTIAAAIVTTAKPAPTTTVAPVTAPPTTAAAPATTAAPAPSSACHSSYRGTCIPPNVSDADCAGGKGDGPHYVQEKDIQVVGSDVFDLDRDGNGVGCQS